MMTILQLRAVENIRKGNDGYDDGGGDGDCGDDHDDDFEDDDGNADGVLIADCPAMSFVLVC